MDAINGLNQVDVSDTVKLLRASQSELAIGMDITLQNPSKTMVLADKGLRLELMSAANKVRHRCYYCATDSPLQSRALI